MLNLWRVIKTAAYARGMAKKHGSARVEPIHQPANLQKYAGCWVAVKNDEVIAAASTSLELVPEVRKLGNSGRGAVAQFVAPHSDAIVIGVG